MQPQQTTNIASWLKVTLLIAGTYNVGWGTFVILFPLVPFQWAGMDLPRYPELWQCIGMIVGVYGVGYAIAASDPVRHWPIVLVGLLGKVFGPIGFAISLTKGTLPAVAAWTIITNDLIWWVPFAMILWHAFKSNGTIVKPLDVFRVRQKAAGNSN